MYKKHFVKKNTRFFKIVNVFRIALFILLFIVLTISTPALYPKASPADPKDTDSYIKAAFNSLIQSYYDEWALIDGYSPLEGFAVTSGLPSEGDNSFGFSRSVKGTAPKDTVLSITVYMFDENKSEFYVTNSVTFDPVGTFEFFDKTVLMDSGDNYIIITACRGLEYALESSVIKCKDFGIKMMLENSIVFPGQWINKDDDEVKDEINEKINE